MNKTNIWARQATIPQIQTMILMNYFDAARKVGVDPYQMLMQAGIRTEAITGTDNRLAASAVTKLIEETARVSRCETFGLLLSEQCTIASLGPLGLVLQLEPTMRDTLRSMVKYHRSFNDILSLDFDEESGVSILLLGMMPGFASHQLIETILAQLVQVLRTISGGQWQPESVHLRHSPPADLSVHKRIFQCPLEFNAAFDGIAFAPEALDAPNPGGNADLVAHAKNYLDMLSADQETSVADQVRHAINQLIGRGTLSKNKVAANLGINPRMLQRMLDCEGTNFGSLLNESRRDLSFRYLTSSSKCILEIADLLGYANASSFTRWFTREFGRSPMTLRNERFRKGIMEAPEAQRHAAFCSSGRCALEPSNA